MAKRKSYEEIFNSEFRWPKKGDKPFVVADDPLDNANVADDKRARLMLMISGYKEAADLMVVASDEDRYVRSKFVFPSSLAIGNF